MSDKPLIQLLSGHVEDMDEDILFCRFNYKDDYLYAEVHKDELRECDREVIEIGSYLYWLVFDDEENPQQANVFYMNQYRYTQEDIDRMDKKGEKLMRELEESGWFDNDVS